MHFFAIPIHHFNIHIYPHICTYICVCFEYMNKIYMRTYACITMNKVYIYVQTVSLALINNMKNKSVRRKRRRTSKMLYIERQRLSRLPKTNIFQYCRLLLFPLSLAVHLYEYTYTHIFPRFYYYYCYEDDRRVCSRNLHIVEHLEWRKMHKKIVSIPNVHEHIFIYEWNS